MNILYAFIYSLLIIIVGINAEMVTYKEIVEFTKPKFVLFSPDGKKVAYVIQNGNIEKNATIDTLIQFDLEKELHTPLLSCSSIRQIAWDGESKKLYVLSKESGFYEISFYSNQTRELLISSTAPITLFGLDSAGKDLIYAQTKYDSDETLQKHLEEGYVYQWKEDSILTVSNGTYKKKVSEEIFRVDLDSGDPFKLTEISYKKYYNNDDDNNTLIGKIALSPKGQSIAFEVARVGNIEQGEYPFTKDILVWDSVKGDWITPPARELLGSKANPCWIDEMRLAFQLESPVNNNCTLYLFDCTSENAAALNFPGEFYCFDLLLLNQNRQLLGISYNQVTLFSLEDNTYKTIAIPDSILPKSRFITPSIDLNVRSVATVRDSSNVPPEVTIYDFEKCTTKIITQLNPWIEKKQLGYVEEIKFQTQNGIESNGFLIHPVNEKTDTRYPLIVATYGFSGGFILDAEWHSSFPTQVLASEGYAVLLLNLPSAHSQNLVGNPTQAMENVGWNRLELFETAVDTLVESGLADPSKVGIYGWSHGGFIVNFVIANSTKFNAACYGEGADYNPSEYWFFGNESWLKIFNNTFGGPPWGETLPNYLSFCPYFHIEKIHTPVLMEFVDYGCAGYEFEMYVPLRLSHKPAELVFYKDEQHNFVRPKARMASMKRKVDWFNYWLLDKRDTDPKFQKQYQRWDAMKREYEEVYPERS